MTISDISLMVTIFFFLCSFADILDVVQLRVLYFPSSSQMEDKSSLTLFVSQTEKEDFEKLYRRVFMFIVPFNIPLCILVLAVCTIVLTYYWRNRGTLTNRIFLLITVADLITCVGHLILMICVVLLSYNLIPPISATVCVVMHIVLSLLGYASSVLFNVVLAVLRTGKISYPFHQVNVRALKIVIAFVIGFLLLLSAVAVWYVIYVTPNLGEFPWITLWLNVAISFVGHNLSKFLVTVGFIHVHIPRNVFLVIPNLLAGLLYLVPITVVLVCLVSQFLVTWLRARARDPDHPVVTDWSRVNTTVSILSAAFLVCNSGIAALQFRYIWPTRIISDDPFALLVCELMMSTTLPLLNALLTPLIIFSRSREMRRNVLMMIRRVLILSQAQN